MVRARPADLDWGPLFTLVRRRNVETLDSLDVGLHVKRVEAGSSEKLWGDRGRNGAFGGLRPGGPVSRRPWRRQEHGPSFASRTWADMRVSRGRIGLGRADEDVRDLVEEAALFGLWADLVLGDDIDERGGNRAVRPRRRRPRPAHPHGGVGGRLVKEETGRRVGRLGSSSVIGTSSPSIEAHPDDDETERRVFSRRT